MDNQQSLKKQFYGVKFKPLERILFTNHAPEKIKAGDWVIAKFDKGRHFVQCVIIKYILVGDRPTTDLEIIRKASSNDFESLARNRQKGQDALQKCKKLVDKLNLPMHLIDVEYVFDQKKLTMYFTAPGKVDFRELLKEMASVFKVRIELRQVANREQSQLLGGIGICGRVICCKTFCHSVKYMPSNQINKMTGGVSWKNCGLCGRVLCCEVYENMNTLYDQGLDLEVIPANGSEVTIDEKTFTINTHYEYQEILTFDSPGEYWEISREEFLTMILDKRVYFENIENIIFKQKVPEIKRKTTGGFNRCPRNDN